MQRFREEVERGLSVADAVATTLDTAGRAVFVSGLAVIVSLAVLIGVPVGILRSVAIGGLLATASALVGALMLLPAILAWLGPRVNKGAVGRRPEHSGPSPFWRHVGELSMRHPVWTALGCVAALLVIASPVLHEVSVFPTRLPHSTGCRVDEALGDPARFDPGGGSSMQVIVKTPGAPLEDRSLRALRAYSARIAAVSGVRGVRTAFDTLDPDVLSPEEIERKAAVDPVATLLAHTVHEDVSLLVATGEHPWRSAAAADVLVAVRAVPHPGLEVKIGGPTATMVDLTCAALRRSAAVLAIGWNFVMLFAAFRLQPLKAVLMNAFAGAKRWPVPGCHLSAARLRAARGTIRRSVGDVRSSSARRWTTGVPAVAHRGGCT